MQEREALTWQQLEVLRMKTQQQQQQLVSSLAQWGCCSIAASR